jgi:RNA polymerase sigma-70 factor (ECF subfamily)
MAVPDVDAVAIGAGDQPALLDERAFHALYNRTAAPLRAYLARTLNDPSAADDLLQDTYLRVLRRPVPAMDEAALRAYVFRIAGNLVVDYWRSHRREVAADVPDQAVGPGDHAGRIDVRRVFARLKPRERQMVWLAHVEGASHVEIARALGLRTASIRVLLSRARHRLARLLRERGHGPQETR